MINCRKKLFTLFFCSSILFSAFAQESFFNEASESSIVLAGNKRVIVPERYRTISLNTRGIDAFLKRLPSAEQISNYKDAPVITIPMPDGSNARFYVWETPMMETALAAAFPEFKTYTGQGIDDPAATIKIDWSPYGFHAMVLTVNGSVFIDPYAQNNITSYISYYKKDFKKTYRFFELPPIRKTTGVDIPVSPGGSTLAAQCIGTQLRKYRLAVACTGEYAQKVTGSTSPSISSVQAAINTTINRVNGVYEKELDIQLNIIANNNKVIFTNPATDPFTGNDDATILIDESQRVIDSAIGNANYDAGHTFSTGAGGVSLLGVVCKTGLKAGSITGSPQPFGDPYDIDYVAHEIGHAFGADHTFNSKNEACAGNGSTITNMEPGSGSTIMAYAGICFPENLQPNSDAYFHTISLEEIATYTINGAGNGCAVKTNSGNSAPVVNAGSDYVIPKSTPFILTGNATDPNGDPLTYNWEQVDVGGPFGEWNNPAGNAPLFRSFIPTNTPTRFFPRLSNVIANDTTIGELMPSYQRTMHFRLTARDNKAIGGICSDEMAVTVSSTTGPFRVTFPNNTATFTGGDFQIITWNKAGTDGAPVNCSNVAIELSTDGGVSFPVVLLASTPNDGAEEISIPNNITTKGRIRIRAIGNVFYDISNNNFSIVNSSTSTFIINSPVPVYICGGANSGSTTLKSGALGGFSTAITLTASQLPSGTSVAFGTNPLAPGSNATITLNNTASLSPGLYTIKITAVAASVTKTKDISFIVGIAGAPASLSLPAANATGVSILPSFNWIAVSSATSYTLEISTSSTYSNIAQTISNINTLPVQLTNPLTEDSVYYWRVKSVNACGTSQASATMRFKTGLNSCRLSTDVQKGISANGATQITSIINIPASLGAAITDVNVVGLDISHAYINDLSVYLTSPANTTITLFDQICDTYPDFKLNLDDQAGSGIPCPPIGGTDATPSEALSAFNGENSTGTWTLTVVDNFDGDGGTLNGWGLNFNKNNTSCTSTATPITTKYTFNGNGNWSIASNWLNNTKPPALLFSGDEIIVDHLAGGKCTLDVTQTIGPGAKLTVPSGKNLVMPGTLIIK